MRGTKCLALVLALGLASPTWAQYGYPGYPAYPVYPAYGYAPTYPVYQPVTRLMPMPVAPVPMTAPASPGGQAEVITTLPRFAAPVPGTPTSSGAKPLPTGESHAPTTSPAPHTSVVVSPPHDESHVIVEGHAPDKVVPTEEVHHEPIVTAPLAASCDGSWRIFAVGGVALLHASPASNEAFAITTNANNGAALPARNTTAIQHRRFQHDTAIAPMAWLGVVNASGIGVRGRYWYFFEEDTQVAMNADSQGNSLAISSCLPAPFTIISSASVLGALPTGTGAGALREGIVPDTFTARQALTMHVGDLEVFQTFTCDVWTFLGGVGVRYAHLGQTYEALRTNPGGQGLATRFLVDQEASLARHDFDGMGPTINGDITRRLGNTGLALYGQGRGALLIGRHRLSLATSRRAVTDDFLGRIDSTVSGEDRQATTDVVPVGELELGAEFNRQVGNVRVLLRAGVIAQTWWNAGSVIGTTGDLDLFGGSFLVGLQY